MAEEQSFQDLRDQAKALGLSAGGSREDIAARIADHQGKPLDASPEASSVDDGDGDGHRPTADPDVPDAERDGPDPFDRAEDKPVLTPMPGVSVDLSEEGDPAGDGTVWLKEGDRTWHVETDGPAYRLLVNRGATTTNAPKGA